MSDEAARARLRARAIEWLRGELAARAKVLDAGLADSRINFAPTLRHWKVDADLAGIRDEKELEKLPQPERAAFRQLWAEVDQLLARASGGR